MDQLEQELLARREAAQKAREKVEGEANERRRLAILKLEVEREEQAAKDAPQIAALEVEIGPIGEKLHVVTTAMGSIAVKGPPRQHWDRFFNTANSNKGGISDHEIWKLAKSCIVYPDLSRVDAILDEYPATLQAISEAVTQLAGWNAKELSGKS